MPILTNTLQKLPTARQMKLKIGSPCPECGNGKLVKESKTIMGITYSELVCDGLVEPDDITKPLEACQFSVEI